MRGASQRAFMVVHGMPPGKQRDVRKLLVGQREGKKMASVMKAIVESEGSRCHHDEGPRPQGSQGRSHGEYT